jgi:hypothetical protein
MINEYTRKIRLKEAWSFRGKDYEKGTEFTVVGSNGIRGDDILDPDGVIIYETRMASNLFENIT